MAALTASAPLRVHGVPTMHKFILENNLPEFFEKRLNQGAVKEYLEENPESVPPGLNTDSEYVIAVRKK